MLTRNWRHGAWLAVAALLVSSFGGGCCCRTRKGIVLRGDWSLELNRVPHMQSNGPTYSCDCAAPTCSEAPGGCSDGCVGGGAYEVIDGSGYPGDAGGHGGSGGGAGGGRGFGGGNGGVPMPEPPQPTPAAQSRFHPVPTRPAFETQGPAMDFSAAPASGWVPESPGRSVRSGADAQPNHSASTRRRQASPIRRTVAEMEIEPEWEYVEAASEEPALLPPLPPEPEPTTSTWRVRSARS